MSSSALAFCITHTSASGHPIYLAPFALWPAFPTADYYGASVAMSLSACRQSRIPCAFDVQSGCRCPFRVLFGGVIDPPPPSERVSNPERCSRVLPDRPDMVDRSVGAWTFPAMAPCTAAHSLPL